VVGGPGGGHQEPSHPAQTALCLASSHGHTPVVRLLCERGADPAIADINGFTPLTRASYEGHLATVRCLLEHPSAAATINQRHQYGRTALWWACLRGHAGVARALLEKGADPTTADCTKRTPMAVAKQYKHQACVKELKVRCSLRCSPAPPFSCRQG
jgi:ankyrin repeat protein